MSDIFISYAREDRETAQRLAEALEAEGWSVWWDTRLKAGEVWDEVIQRELAAARCVIVLWSKTSVQRHWVREEAREGLRRGILVPAMIEDVQPPLPFKGIQAGDLIDWKSHREHPGFKKLMADVASIIGPPPQKPVAPPPIEESGHEPARPASDDGPRREKATSFLKNAWPEWLERSVATIKHYLAAIANRRPHKWHLAVAAGFALLVFAGVGYFRYEPEQPPKRCKELPLQRRTFETDAHRIVAKVIDFSMAGESARLSIQLLATWDGLMSEDLCVNPKEARLVDESTRQEWKAAGVSHSNDCQTYFGRDKNMYWMSFHIGQDLQTTFTAVIPGLAEPIKKLEVC